MEYRWRKKTDLVKGDFLGLESTNRRSYKLSGLKYLALPLSQTETGKSLHNYSLSRLVLFSMKTVILLTVMATISQEGRAEHRS